MLYVYKCSGCGSRMEASRPDATPYCCPSQPAMKRDYKAESVGVTFQGGGWARKSS